MKLIMVRHGESESNISGVTAGWLDVELSDQGLRQAKKVALRLKDEKIDAIFSSDLKRAARTAKEIAKYHDCGVVLDKRLREQMKGKYKGKPSRDGLKDFNKSGKTMEEWAPEGGESMGEVKKKVMDFLNEAEKKYKNGTILMVSHGGPLAVISRNIYGDTKFEPENCEGRNHGHGNTAVSEYDYNKGKWNVVKFNCVEHLK